MTTPSSGTISLTHAMTEIRIANPGRDFPISLGDSDVLALAGKSTPPISLTDLYGKSGVALTATGVSDTTSMSGNTIGSVYTGHAFPSVNVAGGSGGYTFLWTITGGSGYTLASSTSQTCDVSHVIGATGFNGTCTLSCAVTDNTAHTVTATGITAVYTA